MDKQLKPGDFIGSFQIIELIGRGAMGKVYRARHKILAGEYAIKTLNARHLSENDWKRFKNEGLAISKMVHPNIVTIYDMGLHEGFLPYYAMEFLEGTNLIDMLQEHGPSPMQQAIPLFVEACDGLGYAHSKGIVHRDIKPGNLILMSNPSKAGARIKIVDFGVAKLSGLGGDSQDLTAAGEIFGSPLYMSPEQTQGARVDARSDVYSLACTMFQMLTGVPPFKGKSAMDTMLMHQTAQAPTLREASGGKNFPPDLETIMSLALIKDPAKRYQSMAMLGEDLKAVYFGQNLPSLDLGEAFADQAPYVDLFEHLDVHHATTDNTSRFDSSNARSLLRKPLVWMPLAAGLILLLISVGISLRPVFRSSNEISKFEASLDRKATIDDGQVKGDMQLETLAQSSEGMPTDQRPSISLIDKKPYSHRYRKGDEILIDFDFPQDVVIGMIQGGNQETPVRAVGKITYREGDWRFFRPAPVLIKYPALIKRFRAGDVDCLNFQDPYASEALLAACTAVPRVRELQLYNCWKLDPARCAPIFDKFTDLLSIDLSWSRFTGRDLARAHCWSHLEKLYFNHGQELPAILPLINNPALRELHLQDCYLTHKDFETIAQMSGLKLLQLDNTYVTAQDLGVLSRMPALEEIHLAGTKISEGGNAALVQIERFKKLKKVGLKSPEMREGKDKSSKDYQVYKAWKARLAKSKPSLKVD